MKLEDFARRLSAVIREFPSIVESAVKDIEDDIIKLNQDQLEQGKDSADKKLVNRYTGSDKYSPGYSELRRHSGLQTDHFDLRFTGQFQKSLKVVTKKSGNKVIVSVIPDESQGRKYEDLLRMFGDFLGLTPEHTKALDKMITDKVTDELLRRLFG